MESRSAIVCPECQEGICHPNHLDNALVCQRCKATYPKLNGVVHMLRDAPEEASFGQWLREGSLLVRLQESRLWRRNPLRERITQFSFDQEVQSILDAANLKGNERVLDLACGSGSYARLLARHVPGGQVLAVDRSLSLLEYAAHRAEQEGLRNLQFLHADALRLPLPDNSFDVINCCGALHLFADVDQVLAEIQRLLKPGGRFTTAVFRQQKGWFASSLELLWKKARGAKPLSSGSLSLGWLMVRLHKAGLDDSRPYQEQGRWLIMRSTKN